MILAAASYIPFVIAAHLVGRRAVDAFVRGIGLDGGPWTLALLASGAAAYMLAVDAVFPIGRSKVDLLHSAWDRMARILHRRNHRNGV